MLINYFLQIPKDTWVMIVVPPMSSVRALCGKGSSTRGHCKRYLVNKPTMAFTQGRPISEPIHHGLDSPSHGLAESVGRTLAILHFQILWHGILFPSKYSCSLMASTSGHCAVSHLTLYLLLFWNRLVLNSCLCLSSAGMTTREPPSCLTSSYRSFTLLVRL